MRRKPQPQEPNDPKVDHRTQSPYEEQLLRLPSLDELKFHLVDRDVFLLRHPANDFTVHDAGTGANLGYGESKDEAIEEGRMELLNRILSAEGEE